jgi:hypothetical protein
MKNYLLAITLLVSIAPIHFLGQPAQQKMQIEKLSNLLNRNH